jgi:hypothetical protein
MLGALAAIAIVVGGFSSTTILTQEERSAAEQAPPTVSAVQADTSENAFIVDFDS